MTAPNHRRRTAIAIIAGALAIAGAQATAWYVTRGDDPPAQLVAERDAAQICRDEIKHHIRRPDTARWTPPGVTRDGDAYYTVTGRVNGQRYTCRLHHEHRDWRIIGAGLDE